MQIEQVLHQSPRVYEIQHTRWRLADFGQAVSWLEGYSVAGIYRVLRQLRVRLKHILNFIRSPDPNFREKWQAILRAYAAALADPQRVICLFGDELTYYRQPSLAPTYHAQGHTQPYAHQVARYNTQTRLAATLNALTGQVTYVQKSKIGKKELPPFYAQVRTAYPQAERIYLVQDNWPTHLLPEVLAAAQNPLTPLFLPTYASWLNPIEKLWRWLKQDVLHLHPLAHDLDALHQRVVDFLEQFATGSDRLLHYVGLLPE